MFTRAAKERRGENCKWAQEWVGGMTQMFQSAIRKVQLIIINWTLQREF